MRTSNDTYKLLDGSYIEINQSTNPPVGAKIWNGYDYKNQYWVFNGKKDTRTLEEVRLALNNKIVSNL